MLVTIYVRSFIINFILIAKVLISSSHNIPYTQELEEENYYFMLVLTYLLPDYIIKSPPLIFIILNIHCCTLYVTYTLYNYQQ